MLTRQIKELEEKVSYIRDLLSSKQIDPADFREMKADYSGKLERLEVKLTTANTLDYDIHSLLSQGIDNLLKMEFVYESVNEIERKRNIIGSMYPEKMTFDGFRL